MTQRAELPSDDEASDAPTVADFDRVAHFCESVANNPNKHDPQHELASSMLRIARIAAAKPIETK